MSSSYIEHTTKDKNKIEQIDKTSEHQEETKTFKTDKTKTNKAHQRGTNIPTTMGHGLKKRWRRKL